MYNEIKLVLCYVQSDGFTFRQHYVCIKSNFDVMSPLCPIINRMGKVF